MPHIHTEYNNHDQTVSAYIFLQTENTLKILFHTHKKVGKLMVPGGHVEVTENPWQALQHELLEETGYELPQLHVLQPRMPELVFTDTTTVKHPLPFLVNTHPMETDVKDHYHTDLAFLFITSELPKFKVGEGESDTLTWLTEEELNKTNEDEVLLFMKQVGLFAFRLTEEKLWV